MSFIHPEVLWLLLAVPVVGILLFLATLRTRRTLRLFFGGWRRREVVRVLVAKYAISTFLFLLAASAIVIALASPQWGSVSIEDERRGLDLVFLMDVSNSMIAEDVSPSRLVRSREVARAIASRLYDSHRAIVAFKGDASVLVPMTEDPVAFELAIENLSGALLTAAGTSLQRGIDTAVRAFPPGSPRHRAIVLFSDGEELQGTMTDELNRLIDVEIPIYVVVAGSEEGATIPTGNGTVLTTTGGEPVIVRVNRGALESLSRRTGGRVYSLAESGVIQRVVDDLRELSGKTKEVVFREVVIDRYRTFVLIALFLMAVIVCVHHVRWKGGI